LRFSGSGTLNLNTYILEKVEFINRGLKELLPGEEEYPQTLHRAMHYSLFAGGKRIRPVLVLAAAEAVGVQLPGDRERVRQFSVISLLSLLRTRLASM